MGPYSGDWGMWNSNGVLWCECECYCSLFDGGDAVPRGAHWCYSDSKNWLIKGHFFLWRQVVPQITKLNLWEFYSTKNTSIGLQHWNCINAQHGGSEFQMILEHDQGMCSLFWCLWMRYSDSKNWFIKGHFFSLEAGCASDNKAKPVEKISNRAYLLDYLCAWYQTFSLRYEIDIDFTMGHNCWISFCADPNSPSSCNNQMTKPKISYHLASYNT